MAGLFIDQSLFPYTELITQWSLPMRLISI